MTTTEEVWLEHLARKRARLVAQPYSTEASREVDSIDALIDLFWGQIDAEVPRGSC